MHQHVDARRTEMTKREAMKACRWFQKHIGLAGWTITLCMDKCPEELAAQETGEELSSTWGMSATHHRLHELVVWINAQCKTRNPLDKVDPMCTLMHELLHGALFEGGLQTNRTHEYLIDRLAYVLAEQYQTGRVIRKQL